ncbi:MAG: hypothetical protein WC522_09420, partial [Candidatus Omnitrophota bacterium]
MLDAWQQIDAGNQLPRIQKTRDELGSKPLIMDLRSPRNKWWMSTVAVTLIICFIHQDIVWAQEGTPVWSSKASGSFNT